MGESRSAQGVGASVLRKEDDRFLRGRGQFVGDIRMADMQDVAFVRSPLAHARITAIHIPPACRDRVFVAQDLKGVRPIRAVSGLKGFKPSDQPVLATGKVRQVGELIAMCVAPTRAEAEDIAAEVRLDLDELPAVHDMLAARPLIRRHSPSQDGRLSTPDGATAEGISVRETLAAEARLT